MSGLISLLFLVGVVYVAVLCHRALRNVANQKDNKNE